MDQLDVNALLERFKERADSIKDRNLPPVAGEERRRLIAQAQADFMDFSLIGSARWSVEEGSLVLRIPLAG